MVQRAVKWWLDRLVALLLLILAAPLLGCLSMIMLARQGAPLLHRERRVGLGGREFALLKLRSMRIDAESATGPVWTADGRDPRITALGRALRLLHLDELPQLFNVLRGEMSLVGPRPERPEFVDQFSHKINFYNERHRVLPGLTGWAQLCYQYGSSEDDAREKLQYDLYYVKNTSFFLDLIILLETVEVILWGKGAR